MRKENKLSETVYYRGKLTEVKRLDNEDIESQCKRICNEHGINDLETYYDNWKEKLCDEYYQEYYIYDSILFSVDKKEVDLEEDIYKAAVNENNEIEFEVKYYNGGCGFSEALDEALDNMKSE